MAVIKGKTSTGFEFEIDPAVMDDMELIDALVEMTDNKPLAFSTACTKILGKDQKKALYDHLRKDGKVPVQAVSEAFAEFIDAFGEAGKNS